MFLLYLLYGWHQIVGWWGSMHSPVEALFHGWEQFCVTFEPQERKYLTSMGILISGISLQGVVEGGKSMLVVPEGVEY